MCAEVTMRHRTRVRFAVVCIAAILALTGCGSGLTNANGALLTAIAVTPADSSLPVGASQQFKAIGTYSDNTAQDITQKVAWVSSNADKATVSASGLATAVAEGE